MTKLLNIAGNVAGIIGMALCLFAGVARLAGMYDIVGFELITLFIVGIAAMAIGILAKTHALSQLLQK